MAIKKLIKDVAVITIGPAVMSEASKMPKPYGDITSAAVGLGILSEVSGHKKQKRGRLKW
jgi:hypothetical protein